jgi:hypothetical protein
VFFFGVGEKIVDVGFFGQVGGEAYCAVAEVGDFPYDFLGFWG